MPSWATTLDVMDDLRPLAELQGGYLHREQILAHGYTDIAIRDARRDGVLTRVRVGTYVFDDLWRRLEPDQRAAISAIATYDKFPPGSVALSHHSACAVHGISTFGGPPAVHLIRLDRGAGRHESGIVHHVADDLRDDVVEVDGRLVTSAVRATWETACVSDRAGALVAFDSALHHAKVDTAQMSDWHGRTRTWRGSRRARFVSGAADAGAESPGETLSRIGYIDAGLPRPESQYVVTDENGLFVARTDHGLELYRHVHEFDGFRKYLRDMRPGENPSDVVVREKIREDAIRRQDHGVTRSIWSEVLPGQNAAFIRGLARDVDLARKLATRRRVYVT